MAELSTQVSTDCVSCSLQLAMLQANSKHYASIALALMAQLWGKPLVDSRGTVGQYN